MYKFEKPRHYKNCNATEAIPKTESLYTRIINYFYKFIK